ncbi:MAG: hypothetical protein AAF495_12495 [Pseudomonadota bacterium]
MRSRRKLRYRAQRSGHWSESKWTNLTRFDPSLCELRRVLADHSTQDQTPSEIPITQQPIHPAFIMPVSKADVRQAISLVPSRCLSGLEGIFLLGGSGKQNRAASGLFAYGHYCAARVFLHPYPRKWLSQYWRDLPKPTLVREYERAGGQFRRRDQGWWMDFDRRSLRVFYLCEVLMHELGHHVDRHNFSTKPARKAETFADWFAAHYGTKLRKRLRSRLLPYPSRRASTACDSRVEP